MILELVVGTVCAVIGVPALYITLKASAMALRGEEIGIKREKTYCLKCVHYDNRRELFYNETGRSAGFHSWCSLLKKEDPIRGFNAKHNCEHFEAKS